jgi:hypothetical protein
MRYLTILIIFLLSCSENREQKANVMRNETVAQLANGFELVIRLGIDEQTNDSVKTLMLVDHGRVIIELNRSVIAAPDKELGYLDAEFEDVIVISRSSGVGNPKEFKLVEKETGDLIREGILVGLNDEEGIILYISNLYEESQSLHLFDNISKRDQVITAFDSSKCFEEVIGGPYKCVEIDSVDKDKTILSSNYEDEFIRKEYNR